MIPLKLLKDLFGEKFEKDKETKRARRAKVKFRYFSDNKEKNERWTSRSSERSMEEYWNEVVHACHLLLELVPDPTKFFPRKTVMFQP